MSIFCKTERDASDLSTGNHHCSGFTLMEVALAIAVVAIGIMSLFALMTSGLESSAEALADTEAAVFADNVFGGLRGISSDLSRQREGAWETFFDDFKAGRTNLAVAAHTVWQRTRHPSNPLLTIPISVWGNGQTLTNIFRNVPAHGGRETNLVNHVLRYQLLLEPRHGTTFASVTWTNVAEVTLRVWKDEYGNWSTNDALIFYAEIDNPGDL